MKKQFSKLDEIQGSGEPRTELYLRYSDGAAQPLTTQFASNAHSFIGFADEQVSEVGGLQ